MHQLTEEVQLTNLQVLSLSSNYKDLDQNPIRDGEKLTEMQMQLKKLFLEFTNKEEV